MPGTAKLSWPAPATATLAALLRADHDMLYARFEALLSAFDAGARDEAVQLWLEFDHELQAHIDLEERYILPQLDQLRPAEAATVREQHAALRRQFEKLGTGLDLHLTREAAVAEFLSTLAAHAESEDALLHPLADSHSSERDRAAIRALLLDARRRFVARGSSRLERATGQERRSS